MKKIQNNFLAVLCSSLFFLLIVFFSAVSGYAAEVNWNDPSFSDFISGPNGILIFGQNEGGDPFTVVVPAGQEATPPQVSNYFNRLFVFMMGLVGVSAFFMITWGGIQYATSLGNPAAIGAAKAKIMGALLGLLLAGGSVLVVRTINPDLAVFKFGGLPKCGSLYIWDSQSCTGGGGGGLNNTPPPTVNTCTGGSVFCPRTNSCTTFAYNC